VAEGALIFRSTSSNSTFPEKTGRFFCKPAEKTGLALPEVLCQNAGWFCQDGKIRVKADLEAHVFLIRSIRRRLVLLFFAALCLILLLGGVGLQGLLWHLEALDDLNFLLHESPDQERLSRTVSRIGESLHTRLASRRLRKSCLSFGGGLSICRFRTSRICGSVKLRWGGWTRYMASCISCVS
jgi:hypothetical protein